MVATLGGAPVSAGTIQYSDGAVLSIPFNLGENTTLESLGSGTSTQSGALNESVTGVHVTKTGLGTIILGAANTYTGGTTIAAGTLQVGVTGALWLNSALAISSGATFDLNSFSQSLGTLSGSGTILTGTGHLTVGADNSSSSFSGVITHTGAGWQSTYGTFEKAGTGTLNLSGVTITGGENYVTGGSILFSGGSSSISYLDVGTGAGNTAGMNVTDGVVKITSGLQVGDWGGTGTLTQTGGTVRTSAECGDPAHCVSLNIGNQGGTGTYNISGGTLELNGGLNNIGRNTGSTQSTGVLNISGNGLVVLQPGADGYGNGKLILGSREAGTSAEQGKGTINQTGGILRIANGSSLYLSGFGDGTYNLFGGTLQVGGTAGLQAKYGGGSSHGSYEFNLGGGTIEAYGSALTASVNSTLVTGTVSTFDSNGLGIVWNGVLSGDGGLAKAGDGTLTLTQTNTYAGTTTVNGGTLLVNGALTNSDIVVNDGGILGGTGNLRNVVMNGGIFAPGSGTATSSMTVNGSLDFTNGGTYRVFLDPAHASLANVIGTAKLAGGTVNAVFSPGTYVESQYTILSADNVVGKFDDLTTSSLPRGFLSSLDYQGNDVLLSLTATLGIGTDGIGHNQRNVAGAINNYFNNGGALPSAFVPLFWLSGNALSNSLSQITGEVGGSLSQSSFMAMTQFMNVMSDPFGGGVGGASSSLAYDDDGNSISGRNREAYAAVMPKGHNSFDATPPEASWQVWSAGYGGAATITGNTTVGSHDATSQVYGVAVGADRWLTPETLIGFAIAGGGTNFSVAQGIGSGRSDLFQAGARVKQQFGAAYLSGIFAYGWQDVTTDRTVTVSGIDKLTAKLQTNMFSGRAEGGWRFVTPVGGVTPYTAVQITSLVLPGYSEQAASGSGDFALSYAGRTDTQTRSEVGARFDQAVNMNDAVATFRGRAAWAHDFNTTGGADAAFLTLPGSIFSVNSALPVGDGLLVSGGVELSWWSGFSLAGNFEGEFSRNTDGYAGKGVLRYRW